VRLKGVAILRKRTCVIVTPTTGLRARARRPVCKFRNRVKFQEPAKGLARKHELSAPVLAQLSDGDVGGPLEGPVEPLHVDVVGPGRRQLPPGQRALLPGRILQLFPAEIPGAYPTKSYFRILHVCYF
jgi:hypothetical protein